MGFLRGVCGIIYLLVFGTAIPSEGSEASQMTLEKYKMAFENEGALFRATDQLPAIFEESPGTKLKDQFQDHFQKSQETQTKKLIQAQLQGNQGIQFEDEHQSKVQSDHNKHPTEPQGNEETKFEDHLQTGAREKEQLQTEVEENRQPLEVRNNQGTKFEDQLQSKVTKEEQLRTEMGNEDQLETKQRGLQNLKFEEQPETKNLYQFEKRSKPGTKFEDRLEISGAEEDQPKTELEDENQLDTKQREIQNLKFEDQAKFGGDQGLTEQPDSVPLLWTRMKSGQVERKPTKKDFKISRTRRTFSTTKQAVNGVLGKLDECTGGRFSSATRSVAGGFGKLSQLGRKGKTPPTPSGAQRVASGLDRPNSPQWRRQFSDVIAIADNKPPQERSPSSPQRRGSSVRSDQIPWDQRAKLPPKEANAMFAEADRQKKQGGHTPTNGHVHVPMRVRKMPDGSQVPVKEEKTVSSADIWNRRATNLDPAEVNAAFKEADRIKKEGRKY